MSNNKIKVAIVGVGNCTSSLVQGIQYYKDKEEKDVIGLMHYNLGGYKISDIQIIAAFDIDRRKVGMTLSRAIFAEPNCTKTIWKEYCFDNEINSVIVEKVCPFDGVAKHMEDQFLIDNNQKELNFDDIVDILKKKKVDMILNYLPVGTQIGTEYWADIALTARCAFINCIPVFIASSELWANKFNNSGLPLIGDDVKSQLGATVIHRNLAQLFEDRGVKLDRTYQLNVGGNSDFQNMLNRDRLKSKKISKTEAVQSVLSEPLEEEDIHIGPSDYVPFLKDEKVAYIRMEGRLFGNVPMNLELRLSVEDSPDSGGCIIDTIRLAKLALDRHIGGSLIGPSAYYFKHPIQQYPDNIAKQMTKDFINSDNK